MVATKSVRAERGEIAHLEQTVERTVSAHIGDCSLQTFFWLLVQPPAAAAAPHRFLFSFSKTANRSSSSNAQ